VFVAGFVKVRKFSDRNRILSRYGYNVWLWYFFKYMIHLKWYGK